MINCMRLLCVHAHPDDESSKGAGTVAKYVDSGAYAVLVCCTGGEEGEILNKAVDTPEVRDDLAVVRRQELDKAIGIIGYQKLHMLGYRDSGMKDSAANGHPDCFAAAPLEEATARLVKIIRTERPHIVITYPQDQGGYDHPDHVRVNDISEVAFDVAGDADIYPEAGPPWQPLKLYYTAWSSQRFLAIHEKFLELGLESPFDEKWFKRPSQDHHITTKINVAKWYDRRCDALLAHETQVSPDSPFWFGLPRDVAAQAYPWEDYILARDNTVASRQPKADAVGSASESLRQTEVPVDGAPVAETLVTGAPVVTTPVEEDLFAGVDLARTDLAKIDLAKTDLAGASSVGADLEDSLPA